MNYADPARAATLKQGWLLAVDPGVRYPAAAVFHYGQLVAASRVPVPGAYAKLDRGERCRQIAKLIAAWTPRQTNAAKPAAAVVEWPQIYRAGKSKGDPNDLLYLAGLDVGIGCELDVPLISPKPDEWIGGVPKATSGDPWSSPRGGIIRRRLTPVEISNIVVSHDAVDAVGIGLWVLGRLERVLPGTT